MDHGMPGWTPDLERSFKELLFRFLEEVKSTKAALYLLTADGSYALMTQYGFGRRDQLAAEHTAQDPIPQKTRELRTRAWAANGPAEFPEIGHYLEGAGTARMLISPIYADSRVLGFVDARDKGRKSLFDHDDLRRAVAISGAILELIREAGLYPGLEASARAEPTGTTDRNSRGRESRSTGPQSGTAGEVFFDLDPPALAGVAEAASYAVRLDGVAAVAVTATTSANAVSLVMLREGEAVDRSPLLRHQEEALRTAGVNVPPSEAWQIEVRTVPGDDSESGRTIATAVLEAGDNDGLVVSVIGSSAVTVGPIVIEHLETEVASLREASRLRSQRRALVSTLLTPGDRDYPDLVSHSREVSRIAWAMARVAGLDEDVIEEAAIAGLLHDVGMRELDYDRLYRHRAPGPEEQRMYQQHPMLGARILSGTGMDAVIDAVRCHHERWDGSGYPERLSGEAIPRLARIVHLAETWEVLTSPSSYRTTVEAEQAKGIIARAAGQQFDPALVPVLFKVVMPSS
jgi:putative nucleotidyltransferase with HDIG domain